MSEDEAAIDRLDRAVDLARDHVLGPAAAPITLVEYGSYDCPHCRAANERIAELRQQFGDGLRYVFRHRPIPGSALARRAAALVESAQDPERFWKAHVALMTRSETLREADLDAVADELGVRAQDREAPGRAEARVAEDEASARASGVRFTPSFFINGRRYDGAWDESSFAEAMVGSLGHRVQTALLGFARWAPSTGVLLLFASVLAVLLANSALGPRFDALWQLELGFRLGAAGFEMSLLHWIDDGLLTLFFFVVGLEIKREFTVGSLASRRLAALPIAAALGGMATPALLYLLVAPPGPWSAGWGVPIATDTAFAVALIAMLGARVPISLRVFLTAAAIVDDLGAIAVVALFYSDPLRPLPIAAALVIVALLAGLSRFSVYRVAPYLWLGVALWICVYAGGLHATLAGVVLSLFIPTRPPPNLRTLAAQADSILAAEARRGEEQLRSGPSLTALRSLDAIYERLESPADRMLRHAAPRSSYVVLPLFALANAGVAVGPEVFAGHGRLMGAIVLGLVAGKPLGIALASLLAVRLGVAEKPDSYSWRQLMGAGALAGIGFTMSLFIAGQAFPVASDLAAAKVGVFVASVIAAALGVAVLWRAPAAAQTARDGAAAQRVADAR